MRFKKGMGWKACLETKRLILRPWEEADAEECFRCAKDPRVGPHNNDLAREEDEAELGCWVGVPCWGRGLAPEAAREALRHAFEDLGLARVWRAYYEGNEKSRGVQEKPGFRFQWVTENAPVPLLKETGTGYVNLMTGEDWLNLAHIRPVGAAGML